jgi:hypothetical protein
MRRLALLVVLFFAVAAPAQARVRTIDRGIVLGVRPGAIELRELDGSKVRIAVAPRAIVTIDGRVARLIDVRRGYIAWVEHFGARPAVRIRAFSR